MRVKKNFSKLIFFLGVLALALCVPARAFSASVNLSQSILPVNFVYLDRKGGIEKIWSNVFDGDNMYVLKFFSKQNNIELPKSQKLLALFQEAAAQKEMSLNEAGNYNQDCLSVNFRQSGETMEEVRTYS